MIREHHPTLQSLMEMTAGLSEPAFLAAHPEPVLVLHLPDEEPSIGDIHETPTRGMAHVERPAAFDPRGVPRRRDGLVVAVRKNPQNLSSALITIGRGAGNDIVIPSLGVSKLHGYFTSNGSWRYRDAGSRNGSWCAGRRVDRFEPVLLENRSVLRFGPDVYAVWLDAAGLLETVRGMRK